MVTIQTSPLLELPSSFALDGNGVTNDSPMTENEYSTCCGDEFHWDPNSWSFKGKITLINSHIVIIDYVPGRCIVYPLRVLGTQNEGNISDRFWGVQIHDSINFGG